MATYYVRTDTFWQNSPDNWEGPFDSKREAQEWIDEKLSSDEDYVMSGTSPRNIRDAKRIFGVYSKSEARRMGMRSLALGDDRTNVSDEQGWAY